ncbi:MAG: bifunctional phosphopantothenoylcysteine decarboxylase/phosphopantothenate--cysteine ligase CoaBC [Bauldia sp.]|nr:bifunctional phosphopantothenoylcysteine decarboxylase/phosphopantothenate--cysteine ligase CoaBC [Bauldia sp.]
MTGLTGKRILLVVSGGIAAYKALELIRRLRERGASVRAVMTAAAQAFVTPLSVGALTGGRVFTDLLDREDEHDVGHIRLARECDLVLIAPATADLLARMAQGLAGDLATTVLLATDRPVLAAPAMNPRMWAHPATQRNLATLHADGVHFVGPEVGEMAESGEAGLGRMAEPADIAAAAEALLTPRAIMAATLAGQHVLVTAGPTHEPIDPVRYIANRSSGRQGFAVAEAAAAAGARVTLVAGPVALADPPGVRTVRVETAAEMLAAVEAALPADVAVMAAAVGDWRPQEAAPGKLKKKAGEAARLDLTTNPDILAAVAQHATKRPRLVVGFAAETDDLLANAEAKRAAKGCDMIVANDVSPGTGVMGGARNTVHLVTAAGVESWPSMLKTAVAERLVARIAETLARSRAAAE